jgi:hypothetical protein
MSDSGPNWSDIRPGLVELFTELAQNPAGAQAPRWSAEWNDSGDRKASPVTGPLRGITLTLRITTVAGVGRDEIRYEDAGQDLQETIYGLRRVTLNLQCEATHIDDSQWALSVLERIRTRMARRRVFRALCALNVGVIEILPARDVSAKSRQHTLSQASMDLLLTMVASDRDPVVTGVIASVVITSKLEDVDGQLLPTPPNYTDTITTP